MTIKKLPTLKFGTGEYVVYPTHGVGVVSDITKQTIAGTELELLVVNFDKDKMTLRIPTSKLKSLTSRFARLRTETVSAMTKSVLTERISERRMPRI